MLIGQPSKSRIFRQSLTENPSFFEESITKCMIIVI